MNRRLFGLHQLKCLCRTEGQVERCVRIAMKACVCFILAVFLAPASARAQLKDETLLQTLPPGYKFGLQKTQNALTVQEAIPENESLDNWTEMVTTQVFLGRRDLNPDQFRIMMEQRWSIVCKDSKFDDGKLGEEKGYPVLFWVMRCPLNPKTGKPEMTWLKAIKGNDSFYIVQKAFRFEPTQEQISRWLQYLQTVNVCDTRLPDRACPDLRNQGFERAPP